MAGVPHPVRALQHCNYTGVNASEGRRIPSAQPPRLPVRAAAGHAGNVRTRAFRISRARHARWPGCGPPISKVRDAGSSRFGSPLLPVAIHRASPGGIARSSTLPAPRSLRVDTLRTTGCGTEGVHLVDFQCVVVPRSPPVGPPGRHRDEVTAGPLASLSVRRRPAAGRPGSISRRAPPALRAIARWCAGERPR
jgi:hypothetical protein